MQRLARVGQWIARHRLASAGLGVLLAVLALNVLALAHARALTNFVADGDTTARPEELGVLQKAGALCFGVTVARPRNLRTPTDLGLEYSTRTLESEDGLRLEAWLVPTERHRGVVVLCHGYAACKDELLETASEFRDLGFSTLLLDFRGSGGSEGSATTLGYHEAYDVAAAMAEARRLSDGEPVILFGSSMGAAAALRAIHTQGVRPDGLVLEAPFSRLLVTTRRRFRLMGVPSWPSAELLLFWGGVQLRMDAFDHDPVDYARSVMCPTLILHGDMDQRASVAEVREVFDGIPASDKTLTLLAGVGHEPFLVACPKRWRRSVREFLARPWTR